MCEKIEIYKFNTQIKFWSFCNVYLCMYSQKQTLLFGPNKYTMTVLKVKTFADMENSHL